MKKKEQKTPVVTKIPLKSDDYPNLWFDNQEDLDSFDSLMRKKVFYQKCYLHFSR